MRRTAVAVTAMLLLATACSDDDPVVTDTTDEDTTPPDTTPTTDPPIETTEPPVVTTPPTTSTTTTTTTAPADPSAAALEALQDARSYRLECLRALPQCDTTRWSEFMVEPALSDTIDLYDGLNAAGTTYRDLDQIADYFGEIRVSSTDPSLAEVDFCSEDGATVIEQTTTGTTLDQRFLSYLLNATLQLQPDGRWLVTSLAERETVEGREVTLCRA